MQREVFQILTDTYSRARGANPSYSLRAYAKRLDIQVSALSEILNGKRSITKKMATKILDRLGYSPIEIDRFIDMDPSGPELKKSLDLEYFKVISDWYYFAILSLAELDNFKNDPQWVGQRLNISETVAQEALNRLLTLGLLEKNDQGQVKATGIHYKTPTDIANVSLRNHTSQSLDLAKESLFRDSVDIRDFSTVTLCFEPEQMGEAKNMIKNFRKRFQSKFNKGKKSEVYKLAIQLFPLTFGDKK